MDIHPEPLALRRAFRRAVVGYLELGRTVPVFSEDWRLIVAALEEQETIWEKEPDAQYLAEIVREEIDRIRKLFDKEVPQ